jgi:hypothetical protein
MTTFGTVQLLDFVLFLTGSLGLAFQLKKLLQEVTLESDEAKRPLFAKWTI